MRAIDTNILVRFLIGDDPRQAAQARALIRGENVFVSTTVLLESEWVLRRGYRLNPVELLRALRGLIGLDSVHLEDPELVALALDWADEGMDFADALHLGRAAGCAGFVTFDKKLARIAAGKTEFPVLEPEIPA